MTADIDDIFELPQDDQDDDYEDDSERDYINSLVDIQEDY